MHGCCNRNLWRLAENYTPTLADFFLTAGLITEAVYSLYMHSYRLPDLKCMQSQKHYLN